MPRPPRLPALLALTWALAALPAESRSRETAAVLAPGNPHTASCGVDSDAKQCLAPEGCASCPAQQLELTSANLVPRLQVQADSFMKLEERRVHGLELGIYHFRQPARLSELQLPFKLLPLRHIDLTDLRVLEVTPRQAMDSWFPGYAWSILVCTRGQGRHLGWKFTPTVPGSGQQAFYALIVEAVDAEEEEILASAVPMLQGLRAVGQPLAALGLAASALRSAVAA